MLCSKQRFYSSNTYQQVENWPYLHICFRGEEWGVTLGGNLCVQINPLKSVILQIYCSTSHNVLGFSCKCGDMKNENFLLPFLTCQLLPLLLPLLLFLLKLRIYELHIFIYNYYYLYLYCCCCKTCEKFELMVFLILTFSNLPYFC